METYATSIYVISDEVLRLLDFRDDPQSRMSNAEIMTFAIVTAKFFSGNYKMSRYICKKLDLAPALALKPNRQEKAVFRKGLSRFCGFQKELFLWD